MVRMEHRCGARHPLTATVTLYSREGEFVRARMSEVSISGMFVETPAEMFCLNSVIDLEMTVPGTAGLRTYRWKAMVIRKTDHGVGLMFDHVRPPAIVRLMASAEAGLSAVAASNVVAVRPSAGKSPRL